MFEPAGLLIRILIRIDCGSAPLPRVLALPPFPSRVRTSIQISLLDPDLDPEFVDMEMFAVPEVRRVGGGRWVRDGDDTGSGVRGGVSVS
jgi:hypothetical protein